MHTTVELDAEILGLIEKGETFKPGETSATVRNAYSHAGEGDVVIAKERNWIH